MKPFFIALVIGLLTTLFILPEEVAEVHAQARTSKRLRSPVRSKKAKAPRSRPTRRRTPAFLQTAPNLGDSAAGKTPLRVRGQTRTLNMMLILGNQKDKIRFVEIRRNYEEEILNTEY